MASSSENLGPEKLRAMSAETVSAWLKKHPNFFYENPSVLTSLAPPTREMEEGVLDMQRFMLGRLKDEITKLRQREKQLLAIVEGNTAGLTKVHKAALAVMSVTNIHGLNSAIRTKIPLALDIEAAVLCIEEPNALALAGATAIGKGGIINFLGRKRRVLLQARTPGEPIVFGEASDRVKSVAFIKLRTPRNSPSMLLALGSGRDDGFNDNQATDLLSFLAQVIEERLKQCLGRQS